MLVIVDLFVGHMLKAIRGSLSVQAFHVATPLLLTDDSLDVASQAVTTSAAKSRGAGKNVAVPDSSPSS